MVRLLSIRANQQCRWKSRISALGMLAGSKCARWSASSWRSGNGRTQPAPISNPRCAGGLLTTAPITTLRAPRSVALREPGIGALGPAFCPWLRARARLAVVHALVWALLLISFAK